MTLKEYIEILESVKNKEKVLAKGLGSPHSWRGSYDELSFDIVENISIQDMFDQAKECIGRKFTGYKGGDYIFDDSTPINIDYYGDWSDGNTMWTFFLSLLLD